MSWEQAWQEGRTGWDAGESSPELVALVESGALPEGRAFVPGAGSGYDVLTLASVRRCALGVDMAPTARLRFTELRDAAGIPAEQADMQVSDVLAFEDAQGFDMWWDYTFLCALDPPDRLRWAERVKALLAPQGELWVLVFPLKAIREDADGPPYVLSVALVEELLGDEFETVSVREPGGSHSGREGNELIACFRRR